MYQTFCDYLCLFKYGLISSSYSFDWEIFISTFITFIFNIIVTIKITYTYWFVLIFFLFQKGFNISDYSFLWFFFFIFGFLDFLFSSLPYILYFTSIYLLGTITLGCCCFKKIHNFIFITTHHCFMGLGTYLIGHLHRSYLVKFATSFFFIISFCLNLSIPFINELISLKDSSFNSLLIFISLSFNSSKSFSSSKRLFFTLINFLFSDV